MRLVCSHSSEWVQWEALRETGYIWKSGSTSVGTSVGNQAPGKQVWKAWLSLPCSSGQPAKCSLCVWATGWGLFSCSLCLAVTTQAILEHPSFFLRTDWQWCPLLSNILRENSPKFRGFARHIFLLWERLFLLVVQPWAESECVGENELRAGGGGERGSQCNILVNTCHRVPPPASGEALCCSQLSRAKQLPSSRR